MLEEALFERTKAIHKKNQGKRKLSMSDLSTVHEAYQFILGKFTLGDCMNDCSLFSSPICALFSEARRPIASHECYSLLSSGSSRRSSDQSSLISFEECIYKDDNGFIRPTEERVMKGSSKAR